MLVYKIDVLEALKKSGYSAYRIRQEKLLGQNTLQALREGRMIREQSLDKICELLRCQPGDLIEWRSEK